MVVKTDETPWSAKKAFGVWGLLSGAAGAGVTKTIADAVQPNNPDNLQWALAMGAATGALVGILCAVGVFSVRIISPRKTTIQV
jgi:hypothetical protein